MYHNYNTIKTKFHFFVLAIQLPFAYITLKGNKDNIWTVFYKLKYLGEKVWIYVSTALCVSLGDNLKVLFYIFLPVNKSYEKTEN